MDSVTIKPSFRVPSCRHSNPSLVILNSYPFSVFKFNHFNKFKSSPISVSHRRPRNPKTLNKKCIYTLPINPFWVLLPILQSLRGIAASGTQTGCFLLKNSVEGWASCLRGIGDVERVSDGESLDFLQSGGIGMALLSVTSTAKVRMSPFVTTLAANPTFVSSMLAWMIAQSMKMFLNFFVERKWDFRILFSSGGMPSSHSALCTALSTSVALCHGVADSLFPVCLGFSLIVMYDAIGVRRHAGMQAEVLNLIIADLFQGHPISQRKLKVLLGHTPSQVLAGALLGILVACVCCQGYLVGA